MGIAIGGYYNYGIIITIRRISINSPIVQSTPEEMEINQKIKNFCGDTVVCVLLCCCLCEGCLFLSKMYVFSQATDPSSQHNSKKKLLEAGSLFQITLMVTPWHLPCCAAIFVYFHFLVCPYSGESLKIMVHLKSLIRTLRTCLVHLWKQLSS